MGLKLAKSLLFFYKKLFFEMLRCLLQVVFQAKFVFEFLSPHENFQFCMLFLSERLNFW